MKRRLGPSDVHVPGVKRFLKKGRWYAYHRASGTRLMQPFDTAAFQAELEAVEKRHTEQEANVRPGTLGALFEEYRAERAWPDIGLLLGMPLFNGLQFGLKRCGVERLHQPRATRSVISVPTPLLQEALNARDVNVGRTEPAFH